MYFPHNNEVIVKNQQQAAEVNTGVPTTGPEPNDLLCLLALGKINPFTDLMGMDMSCADFGTADVSGWNFVNAKLDNANMRNVRNIRQARFNTSTSMQGTKLPRGVTLVQLTGE